MGNDANGTGTLRYYTPRVLAVTTYLLMTPMCDMQLGWWETFFLETRSCYIALANLEFVAVLLPQPSDYRQTPQYPGFVHSPTNTKSRNCFGKEQRSQVTHLSMGPLSVSGNGCI